MRKVFVISVLVDAGIVGTVAAYRHFRILPIDLERQHSAPLTNFDASDCSPEVNLSTDRAAILHAGPNVSSVTINADTWHCRNCSKGSAPSCGRG